MQYQQYMHKSYMPLCAAIRALPNLKTSTKDVIITRLRNNLGGRHIRRKEYICAKRAGVSYANALLANSFGWSNTAEGIDFWANVDRRLRNRFKAWEASRKELQSDNVRLQETHGQDVILIKLTADEILESRVRATLLEGVLRKIYFSSLDDGTVTLVKEIIPELEIPVGDD